MMKLLFFTVLLWSSLAIGQEKVLYEFLQCQTPDCPIQKKMSKFERIPHSNFMVSVAETEIEVNGQLVDVNQLALLDTNYGKIGWYKLSSQSRYEIKTDSRWNFILLKEFTLCEGAHINDCFEKTGKVRFHMISEWTSEPSFIGEFDENVVLREGERDSLHIFEIVDHSSIEVTNFDIKKLTVIKKFTHKLQGISSLDEIRFFNNTFQYVNQSSQKDAARPGELIIVNNGTGETTLIRPSSFDEAEFHPVSDDLLLKIYRKRTGIFYSVLNLKTNFESDLVLMDRNPKADFVIDYSQRDFNTLVIWNSYSADPEWRTQIFNLETYLPMISFKEKLKYFFTNQKNNLVCHLDSQNDLSDLVCQSLITGEVKFKLERLEGRAQFNSHFLMLRDTTPELGEVIKIFDLYQNGQEVLSLNAPNFGHSWIEDNTLYLYDESVDGKKIFKSYNLK